MSNHPLNVIKRDGHRQPLDINKIHAVLEWACHGDGSLCKIRGVSISDIEMRAQLQFHDGLRTKDIHGLLIKAAESLISEDNPNYDWVAARLRWFAVRKEAFGDNTPPHLRYVLQENTRRGLYDPAVINMYTPEEWNKINDFIDHGRDDLFRLAGAEQMAKKYLVQNRKTKQIYETFQFPYILVAAILFHKYPKEVRLDYVKRYYDQVSQHFVSLPTPIMAGLRTRTKQFSSCTLIEVGDSLQSINASASAIVEYASNKAGVGLNIGRIRAEGQAVRGGEAVTTGVLPFAKYFAAALKSCSQGAVRGASATFNWPVWHLEFERLIELKNNKGTEETRLRTVDYCVHLNETMYRRLSEDGMITFFSPEEVPDLYEAFYGPAEVFEALYVKYEKDRSKTKKQLKAKDVFAKIVKERFETGRIYIMHADHVNAHGNFLEMVNMTNLCTEITLPTTPMGNDEARIALCTLSAMNFGKIDTEAQMAEAAEMAVRGLDALLDYQDYPNIAARRATMQYRSLGVGIIGFAHFLAKNGLRWGEERTLEAVAEKVEQMAWHLTKTSIDLAEEFGACQPTKMHEGVFPIDTSKIKVNLKKDWKVLRVRAQTIGVRNGALMSMMPSETSSQLANETNGVEPPKALISMKGSKDVTVTQVVPDYRRFAHAYETAWDVSVENYIKTLSMIQAFTDQAISANTSYNPEHYPEGISTSALIRHLILAWKSGLKTLYYNNTLDDAPSQSDEGGCDSGACKI